MNFEDSDEECDEFEGKFCYWNNWTPKNDKIDISKFSSKRSKQNLIVQCEMNISRTVPTETGNEATPSSLGKTNIRNELKLLQKKRKNIKRKENLYAGNRRVSYSDENNTDMPGFSSHIEGTVKSGNSKENFIINKDWGKRIELHNILHINEGEKVWNIISRGIFAEVKLWKNEYGNICCKASGKISVTGTSEKSLIEINTRENLRKMLNLSSMQWSALCEAVQEKNCCLSFNALNDTDIEKISSLEKLWFLICKRRHFLPNICVLGKLSGAVKLLKELRIIPKLVVLDIRDFKGEEIS